MKKKDLLKQLNNLQTRIKPDQSWQTANRDILLSQIKAQTTLGEANKFLLIANMVKNQIVLVSARSFLNIAILGLLVLGSWVATTNATKNSLPGDLLYGLKLTTERVKVNITLDDEKRTNLEIEYAERRLDEVKQVVENGGDNKDVNVALKKFQEGMTNAKSNLAKLEIKDSGKAVKVANLLDEKAQEFVGILVGHKETSPESAQNTDKAITASKSTADKALSVIIKEFEAGESNLSQEQVIAKVQARIEQSSTKISLAMTKLSQIEANIAKQEAEIAQAEAVAKETAEAQAEEQEATQADTQNKESDNNETTTEAQPETTNEARPETTDSATKTEQTGTQPAEQPENKEPDTTTDTVSDENPEEKPLPTLADIKEMPKQVTDLLAEAQELLNNQEILSAFAKIKQADELINTINKVIVYNVQYLDTKPQAEPEQADEAVVTEETKEGE